MTKNFKSVLYPIGTHTKKKTSIPPKDIPFKRETYIKYGILTTLNYLLYYHESLSNTEEKLVEAYRKLNDFYQGYCKKAIFTNSRGTQYLFGKKELIAFGLFSDTEKKDLIHSVITIKNTDFSFANSFFNGFSWAANLVLDEASSKINLDTNFGKALDDVREIFFNATITSSRPTTLYKNLLGEEFTTKSKVFNIERQMEIDANSETVDSGLNLIYDSKWPEMESYPSEKYLKRFISQYKENEPEGFV